MLFRSLHCNCFAYLHGHQFGGINPSILKALGYSNLIFALNTPFNAEVLDNGKFGVLYEKNSDDLAAKMRALEGDTPRAEDFRRRAPDRIRERFTWERITDEYEELFRKIVGKR